MFQAVIYCIYKLIVLFYNFGGTDIDMDIIDPNFIMEDVTNIYNRALNTSKTLFESFILSL